MSAVNANSSKTPRTPSPSVQRAIDRERLRSRVIAELERSGFVLEEDGLISLPEGDDPKQVARQLHSAQREAVLAKNASFIESWQDKVLDHLANGSEVNPAEISPRLVAVEDDVTNAALFRYASLSWSVPVSQGYGRRTRFLIIDESNDKLIGIAALGDPVFNLGVRDRLIEWDQQQRQERLYNVYDAYVLGAVEPYRQLLGGKLVALCAVANETADYLTKKYEGTTTVIKEQSKSAEPVLITTTSALGRSSVYNRLKMGDQWIFKSVGFTEGFGHFHFSDELFNDIVEFVKQGGTLRGHQYGEGPNWRIRTLRRGLKEIGLDGELLRHGIKREVFVAPRALGWRAFLRGDTDDLWRFDYPLEELGAFWRERWAVPRAKRDRSYKRHKRKSMKLADARPRHV
jgi:hypothetical protein